MAFPPGDTAIIDDFNRADGPVYAGAGATVWGTTFINGDAAALAVSGNALAATVADGGCVTNESETDFIRIFDITAASGGYVAFGWRVTNVGASFDSYGFLGQGTNWKILRYDNGVNSEIASSDVDNSLSVSMKIGVKVVGSLHEVYLYAFGAWDDVPVLSVTDATYAGPGAMWFSMSSTSWKVDNYASGEMGAPTVPVTIHVDADHAAASDVRTRAQAADPDTPFLSVNAACRVAWATPTWADTVLVKRSTEGNADPANTKDPDLYPILDHRWTDRSEAAPGWLNGDNTGNQTIVVRGDVSALSASTASDTWANIKAASLPKIHRLMSRGLTNWRFERLQFGYDVSSDAERQAGTGWDFSTLGSFERSTDIEFKNCHATGGLGIPAWWAGYFKVTECVIHAPLPPDGGNPGFHDGAALRMERLPNDSEGGVSVGQITVSRTEFSNVRGDDGCTVGGVLFDDPQYDEFDMVIEDCLFHNVTEGNNPAFHTDSIQALAVPRCRVSNCVFIGNATSFMASDGRNGEITFENNLVIAAGSPFQMQGTDHVILRHNTFIHTTSLRTATLLFFQRAALPEPTIIEMHNNIIGGFYMRDDGMSTYFHEDSVIENNLVLTSPGGSTPFGNHLPGIPEFGYSPRMDPIPNLIFEIPGMAGEPTVTLPRNWELANTPVLSPGIGDGQTTALTADRLGRAYASPPDVGCHQSIGTTAVTAVARPPYITDRTPSSGATGVAKDANVVVTLYPVPGTEMDPATVSTTSVYVKDSANVTIPAVVTLAEPDVDGFQEITVNLKSSISPLVDGELFPLVVYTVFLTNVIEDLDGSALEATSWSFRVAALPGPAIYAPGTGGGGGPSVSERVTNDFATVSAASLTLAGTSLTVANAPPSELLGGNFRIRIEDPDASGNPSGNNVEFLNVTDVNGPGVIWTVTREAENPARFPAVAHPAGSIVTHVFTAAALMGIVGSSNGSGGGSTLVALGNSSGAVNLPTAGASSVVARGLTLIGNVALTLTGLVSGQAQEIDITGKQDATGGRALSISDGSGPVTIPAPTDSNAVFQVSALWDGSDLWVDLVGAGSSGGGGNDGGNAGIRFEQDVPALTTSRPHHLAGATDFVQAWVTVDVAVGSDVDIADVLINDVAVETLSLTSGQSTALLPVSVSGNEGDVLALTRLSMDGGGLVVELLEAGGVEDSGDLISLGSISGVTTLPTSGQSVVAHGAILTGNTQLDITGLGSSVQRIDITGKQDATGGRTLSINDGSGAVAVSISTSSNADFHVSALWDGTDLWVDVVGG